MRSRAVVLTYPGHFLLTQLTLRSIKEHLPEVKEIVVIADDCSPLAWPRYKDQCLETYPFPVVFASETPVKKIDRGWVRQQVIKMYIDWFTDWPEFFFADGDVCFKSGVPVGTIPYAVSDLTEIDHAQTHYVSQMLGVERQYFRAVGVATTNNFGFRDIDITWWQSLRQHIESLHGQSVLDLHSQIADYRGVSEWELLETFKNQVLNLKPNLTRFFCQNLQHPCDSAIKTPMVSTCWCTDKQLGLEWWQQQPVNLDIWEILPNSK